MIAKEKMARKEDKRNNNRTKIIVKSTVIIERKIKNTRRNFNEKISERI